MPAKILTLEVDPSSLVSINLAIRRLQTAARKLNGYQPRTPGKVTKSEFMAFADCENIRRPMAGRAFTLLIAGAVQRHRAAPGFNYGRFARQARDNELALEVADLALKPAEWTATVGATRILARFLVAYGYEMPPWVAEVWEKTPLALQE